jgi:IS605 OrfB family transposase
MSKSAKRQAALGVVTKVLRLRIKDKHASHLLAQSREVNQVWNFCNETSQMILRRENRFCSDYDLNHLTAGATKEGLSLHSQTLQAISNEYCTRRKQFKKAKLRWRVSRGAKRSLGWIPVKTSAIVYKNGQVHYQGKPLSLWDSYGLSNYTLRSGNFCEDSRGRWYLNVTVETKRPTASKGTSAIGIDLGLKDFAAFSNGETIEAKKIYRSWEPALAKSQRAGNKARTRAIHAKIANQRKDFLHKLSTSLVREHGAIFVGDVSASKLTKTNMAKSVLDAGWSTFRTMLRYKSDHAAVWFDEVDERYSTQECHVCHALTGPKGLLGLGVRQWTCSECNSLHQRDTNSAIIIRERGLRTMGISIAAEAGADEVAMNKSKGECALLGAGYGPLNAGITVPLGRWGCQRYSLQGFNRVGEW